MKRRAVPLHVEVASVLRHQILSGELDPGVQLPALNELTRQLGVARMTVVQAMNTLENEGLIERFSGRGTFVKKVKMATRETLKMRADLSELHSMVSQLQVSVLHQDNDDLSSELGADVNEVKTDGHYRCMDRIHNKDGKPFCAVTIRLANDLFEKAPERFKSEIVVTVLRDLGIKTASAHQRINISYADFEQANALCIDVNSAVFKVYREFFDDSGALIYSANLIYPGDLLQFEIDFAIDP